MKHKSIVAGVSLLIAAAAGVAWLWLSPTGLTQAPDVAFKTLDGDRIEMNELQGRPVLVTFWATTCASCRKEVPHLIELYNEFGPRGFELIAVAMPYDPPNQVLEMAKSRGIPYPVALDIDGNVTAAFGDVSLTPTSFLIAPDGRIAQRRTGEMDMERLRERVREFLAKPARAS